MTVFNFTLYTDTICPWCYIGDRNIEKAINIYKRTYPGGSRDVFEFGILPFYLDPNAPIPGVPMAERITEKNGEEMARGITSRLERVGRATGINFSFRGKIGRTRDSHRLLYFAGQQDPVKQKRLLEQLFHDLFEGSADITSHSDLKEAAISVGLDGDEVTNILDSDIGGAEVDRLANLARERGIRHVPFVELNGTTFEGSQDVTDIYEALVSAKAGELPVGSQ